MECKYYYIQLCKILTILNIKGTLDNTKRAHFLIELNKRAHFLIFSKSGVPQCPPPPAPGREGIKSKFFSSFYFLYFGTSKVVRTYKILKGQACMLLKCVGPFVFYSTFCNHTNSVNHLPKCSIIFRILCRKIRKWLFRGLIYKFGQLLSLLDSLLLNLMTTLPVPSW